MDLCERVTIWSTHTFVGHEWGSQVLPVQGKCKFFFPVWRANMRYLGLESIWSNSLSGNGFWFTNISRFPRFDLRRKMPESLSCSSNDQVWGSALLYQLSWLMIAVSVIIKLLQVELDRVSWSIDLSWPCSPPSFLSILSAKKVASALMILWSQERRRIPIQTHRQIFFHNPEPLRCYISISLTRIMVHAMNINTVVAACLTQRNLWLGRCEDRYIAIWKVHEAASEIWNLTTCCWRRWVVGTLPMYMPLFCRMVRKQCRQPRISRWNGTLWPLPDQSGLLNQSTRTSAVWLTLSTTVISMWEWSTYHEALRTRTRSGL